MQGGDACRKFSRQLRNLALSLPRAPQSEADVGPRFEGHIETTAPLATISPQSIPT